jgi:hypothetical protein
MNNKEITITEATARRALERLTDWLEWVEDLDAGTRADVLALDELIKALDAEDEYEKMLQDRRERAQKAHQEHQARKKAEAGE